MAGAAVADTTYYPDSDGKPMGETPRHVKTMLQTFGLLDLWFESDALTYVGCNMFVYYQKGNRRKHVSPDVFVVRDIPKERDPERRSYKTWEEGGKGPDWALEVTSDSTRVEDLDTKFEIYQDVLRVQEYFLFDPYGEYLDPPLRGYRLVNGVYQPIEQEAGRFPSEVLQLHLERDELELRLYDPHSGARLPTFAEKMRGELTRLKNLKQVRRKKNGK